ncbi:hypothetical protein [Pseudonocardia dioxanivorans]|uniref:hypothetical protein n=1 Tax=Pseudonocardia dioxanivorans TaxID=240495 RepID=UPI000CD2ACD6|nr:hypothetical protein [Pseudonocardia dioxanivorans]
MSLPLLSCTACGHTFSLTADEIARLPTIGCPHCQGWTWLVSTTAAPGPDGDPVPIPRGGDEENRDV